VSSSLSAPANISVAIIPPPSASNLGNVTFQYYAQCSDLVNANDVPFNAQNIYIPYNDLLAYYATAKIDGIEGDDDGAKMYNDLFQASLKIMQSATGMLPNYRPSIQSSGSNH
jgi:hypothetical protein